jgi:cell division protein FtsN
MIAIAAAVVVAFIGGLYFITHHKKEESEALQGSKVAGNGLPPKPEERWRYIKELESRQPGVRAPTEPSAGGEVQNANQLTGEQRQLLAQMQADMRQQPTQLNEVLDLMRHFVRQDGSCSTWC